MKSFWNLLRVAGILVTLPALVSLAVGAWIGYKPYHEMKTWPAVDAEVVQRAITSRTSRGARLSDTTRRVYSASFIFRYTVNGELHFAQKDIGYEASSEKEMAEWVQRLPDGSHRTIRYDPSYPLRISLAAGFDSLSFAPTLAIWRWSAILIVLGFLMFAIGNRFGKKES